MQLHRTKPSTGIITLNSLNIIYIKHCLASGHTFKCPHQFYSKIMHFQLTVHIKDPSGSGNVTFFHFYYIDWTRALMTSVSSIIWRGLSGGSGKT
jgi:hypothetical protein